MVRRELGASTEVDNGFVDLKLSPGLGVGHMGLELGSLARGITVIRGTLSFTWSGGHRGEYGAWVEGKPWLKGTSVHFSLAL